MTNIGKVTDTFNIRSIPYDSAPALQFSANPGSLTPEPTHSMTLTPGQTKTVYAYWISRTTLPQGEYQGHILVEGKSTAVLTPYWYAVPSLIPNAVLELNPPNSTARSGATVTLFVRVMDLAGVPVTTDGQLRFTGTASAGATINLLPQIVFQNLRAVQFGLATTARANTFQFTFGNLPPITHVITGGMAP